MNNVSRRLIANIAALSFAFFSTSAAAARLAAGEGFIQVPGGPVWYRIFGSGTATPLLMLHGGPGGNSCHFDPLATLVSAHRPVVIYDQLGAGRSGRPLDRSLWTLERSRQELAAVRRALGLKSIHLLGNSWGAAIAGAYALESPGRGIRSLVLSGPLLSTPIWIEDANALRHQLPQRVQEALTRNEKAGTVHSAEYQEANRLFESTFVYRGSMEQLPASCKGAAPNPAIYEYMWGPSEFNATGTLLHFDITADLHRLKMPVLFTGGRYDEARPATLERFQAMIPGSRVRILENSAHLAHLEEYREYARILNEFLDQVDLDAGRLATPN